MESAFGWLGEFFRYLLNILIPGVALIHRTHGAVRFRRGKEAQELKPGLYFFWRLTTSIFRIPVVRDTLNLLSKPLVTRDKQPVIVGTTIVFRVIDPLIALSQVEEIGDAIVEVAMTALPSLVLNRTWDELTESLLTTVPGELSPFEQELSEHAAAVLEEFGVEIIYCKLNSIAPARVFYVAGETQSLAVYGPQGQHT